MVVSLDRQEIFVASDTTFGETGRIALWTKADSLTHFDALEVEPLQP